VDTIAVRHGIGDIIEAVRTAVERQLGRKRKLYTAEDLVDDVGLSPEQFQEVVTDLEHHFGVEIETETLDQLTVVGALVVRFMRLCSEAEGDRVENEAEVA
jgi:acyl carrier protein